MRCCTEMCTEMYEMLRCVSKDICRYSERDLCKRVCVCTEVCLCVGTEHADVCAYVCLRMT